MNWIKRIFNWKKAPKATNEMKLIDAIRFSSNGKDWETLTKTFVYERYWRVKKSWRRSPKNYYIWISDDGDYELRKYNTPNGIEMLVGNLYTLYQQYYGKENKN